MVWMGRKAQLLARRGMDIPDGNPPSRRRAFARCSPGWRIPRPTPDAAGCGRPHPNCGLSRDAGCSQHSSAGGTLEAVPLVRTAGNSGWSADTSAPGPPPQWLYPPFPSPPSPPASPQETPVHPGYSQPAGHRSRSAVSRSHPLFSRVSACGSPSSSGANPSVSAASTVGWFPFTRTR